MEANSNEEFVKSGFHGSEGPLKISDGPNTTLRNHFLKAGEEMGQSIRDVNGQSEYGFMHLQRNVHDGRRWTVADGYLRTSSGRENLHIVTQAHVSKVLFEGKKAVGVEYIRHGKVNQVRSKTEVILAGGTIGTPQLLMLSGVGPKKELQRLKIPVLADLPVGQNLEDHIFTDACHFTITEPLSLTEAKMESFMTKLQYSLFRSGLRAGYGSEALGFLRSSYQPKSDKFPYIQLLLFSTHYGSGPVYTQKIKEGYNYKDEVWDALFGNSVGQEGFSVLVIFLHPSSKGNITLRSRNPEDHPVITSNYLKEDIDLKHMLDGLKFVTKMEDTESFKSIGAKLSRRHHPLCKPHHWGTDEYWSCYIRESVVTLYHPTSTCKMGPVEDQSTVVDTKLRVKGLAGLRITDASIMPFVSSGNTMAPVIMIGEKAADIIKKEHHLR